MPKRIKPIQIDVRYVPNDEIYPNPWNRTVFDPVALEELARSIRVEGIREPLIVRPLNSGRPELRPTREAVDQSGSERNSMRVPLAAVPVSRFSGQPPHGSAASLEMYEIASGNRRWLAAQQVGLKELPCLIESLSDEQVAEDNIVMNIQREDIPPLELARMVQEYMKTFQKKQKDAARTFGKSKTWVSLLLTFLDLPPEALKKFKALNLGWDTLRAIRSLGTDLTIIIAKELEDGSLTPRRIIKRCNQLLYGRHLSKGAQPLHRWRASANASVADGFQKEAPRPADPLKKEWEKVNDEVPKGSQVWWEVQYGKRKLPNGERQEGWYFFAAPTVGEPREALASWFTNMGKALAGKKVDVEKDNPYLRASEQTKQMEQNVMKLLGPRVPKTAEEKAELSRISATEGPRGVYRWIYGKDSPMAQAVPVDSWEAIGTTPEAGLKDILKSL